jgi:hypothetical protein
MNDPPPDHDLGAPARQQVDRRELLKTRIGSSELRTVTALVRRIRFVFSAAAASTTAGVETAKSGRWCSPTPNTSRPISSASSTSSMSSRSRRSGPAFSLARVANVKTPISIPALYRPVELSRCGRARTAA